MQPFISWIFILSFLRYLSCFATEKIPIIDEIVMTQIGSAKVLVYSNNQIQSITNPFIHKLENQYFLTFARPFPEQSNLRNVTFFAYTDKSRYQKDADELENTLTNFNYYLQNLLEFPFSIQNSKFHFIVNQDHSGLFLKHTIPNPLKVDQKSQKVSWIENDFLFDWQMADSTIGGQLIHDEKSRDRFILPIRPGQGRGIVKIYENLPRSFNETQKLGCLPTTFFAPIDYVGAKAVGSWKGKMLALSGRGVIEDGEASQLFERQMIPINNLKDVNQFSVLGTFFKVKDLPSPLTNCSVENLETIDNMSILTLDKNDFLITEKQLQTQLGIRGSLMAVYRIVKRDSGFSRLDHLPMLNFSYTTAVVMNRSTVPKGYDYYNISEDLSSKGLPLIQLYHFDTENALVLPAQRLRQMLLTPTDEFLYRSLEQEDFKEIMCTTKLHTEIEIYIFN